MRKLLPFFILFILAFQVTAQRYVWYQGISETSVNLRGNPIVLAEITIEVPEAGDVAVLFDGHCYADVGDRIVLAASDQVGWLPNDGNVAVEVYDKDINHQGFSHTRVYPVTAGKHTFYAIGQNYVEEAGNGVASVYGNLTVKYFPAGANRPFIRHQGIKKSSLYLRDDNVVVAQEVITSKNPGTVLVRFDGLCVSSPGDRILMAASDTPTWSVNDGQVSMEAINDDINTNSFSHSRLYTMSAGTDTFYAVARNYVEVDGTGMANIYGSLTVEFFPDLNSEVIVKQEKVNRTGINIRPQAYSISQIKIDAPRSGRAVVNFNGYCLPAPGDLIVLAASNDPYWLPNDGNVSLEAVSNDLNRVPFSHTRVYDVKPGSHEFHAVVQNYVETDGTGKASMYGSLTVEFYPDSVETLAIDDDALNIPQNYFLAQNYPNPFNPATQISYTLARAGDVQLKVYDLLGRDVGTLVNGHQPAGAHQVVWQALGRQGNALPAGVYLYQLRAGSFLMSRKMVLMK